MARTRAQVQAEKQGKPAATEGEAKRAEQKHGDAVPKKRSAGKATTPASKKRKTTSPPGQRSQSAAAPKIDQLINENGSVPLADLGLKDTEKRTSETVLAHIFNALISSARIGHDIAHRTLQCLVDANYHDLGTLKKSTWEERTKVLTDGGYTHYREKTATYLGELAQRIEELYDNDATRFLDGAKKDTEKKLKEIKGLGPLGVDIFFETIQAADPDVAPFVGKRNLDAAKDLGLGSVEAIWHAVEKDNKKMSQLCAALTKTRLEGSVAARK